MSPSVNTREHTSILLRGNKAFHSGVAPLKKTITKYIIENLKQGHKVNHLFGLEVQFFHFCEKLTMAFKFFLKACRRVM